MTPAPLSSPPRVIQTLKGPVRVNPYKDLCSQSHSLIHWTVERSGKILPKLGNDTGKVRKTLPKPKATKLKSR